MVDKVQVCNLFVDPVFQLSIAKRVLGFFMESTVQKQKIFHTMREFAKNSYSYFGLSDLINKKIEWTGFDDDNRIEV